MYYTGYSQAVLDNRSTAASYDGAYVQAGINFTTPSAAVRQMLDNLQKYVPGAKSGQIPDYGVQNAYLTMDLMIDGLEHAGSNPTRTSFIDNLHQVSTYTAGGIFPSPGVSFSLNGFGTAANALLSPSDRLTDGGAPSISRDRPGRHRLGGGLTPGIRVHGRSRGERSIPAA